MKKLFVLLLFVSTVAFGQSYPSPTYNNLTVNGTLTQVGQATFTLDPTAPTPAAGTNSTALSTTAFVAQHSPCLSIMDYGGNNVGGGSNNAAFTATVAANPTGDVCVYFPPGTYAFASQATYAMPNGTASITIKGAGYNTTTLSWAAGGGLAVNYAGVFNSVHIRDMTIATGTTNTGFGIGLNMVGTVVNTGNSALSDISNVTLRGADGYSLTDYWGTAIDVSGVSNVNFLNIHIIANGAGTGGLGVNLHGSSTQIPVIFDFVSCYFETVGQGIVYGPYVQGVAVSNSNFVGGTYGIANSAGQLGDDQLAVSNSQFANTNTAILLQSIVSNISIVGNSFLSYPTGTAINLTQPQLFTISGNNIANQGTPVSNTGINIGTNLLQGTITGNTVVYQASAGINLNAGSGNIVAIGNSFSNNGVNTADSGTNNNVDIRKILTGTGTAVSLTNGFGTNVTSVSLTAGQWSCSGVIEFNLAGTTTATFQEASISTTSATNGGLGTRNFLEGFTSTAGAGSTQSTPTVYFNVTTTTPIYLVGQLNYTVSTATGSGTLSCLRIDI